MNNKKILIVSVSKGEKTESLLFQTYLKSAFPVEFTMIENNSNSLASVYNKFLTPDYKDYIICFVHDDVCIADALLIDKLHQSIEKYDVFGVAGGAGKVTITSDKPALWHLISEKKVGFAGHYNPESKNDDYISNCFMTSFGLSPSDANLIDGVFIGVNVEKVLEKGVKFDENCPAKFHFYDLLFSINSKKKGLKLGVVPIVLFHKSHGLTKFTQEFIDGDMYFKKVCAN